jgi:transposase-like protein
MTTKKKPSKKVGRPKIVVTKEMCDKAERYASQGLTVEQIASVMGIGQSTLYDKQNEFLEEREKVYKQ